MLENILNFFRKLIPRKIFRFFQPVYHYTLAVSGNIFYRFPGKKIRVIGITGTNGKSTTVELANAVLKENGYRTGMISTVAVEIAGVRTDNITSRTTLGRWQTLKLLRQMVRAKCDYAVLEVASEGIAWYRVWGIPFDVAVFTNLSPEHLNFHKTMSNYRNTKGKLFLNLSLGKKSKKICGKKTKIEKINIVNADDREAGYFGAFPADLHLSYGIKRGEIIAKNIRSGEVLNFDISYRGKNYPIHSALFARFNVYNILAAWAVGISQKIDPRVIENGIKGIDQVKGRMELVGKKKGIKFYVDYAMTPDSYEMLISELRNLANGKVILVFGAAGDRDKSKRPLIGEVAARMADFSVLTDDEPYSEDPAKIIEEIESGFKKIGKKNYKIVPDRKKAFADAINLASSGDVIVAIGMGHEKFRNIGGNKKISWNESEIIKNLLS